MAVKENQASLDEVGQYSKNWQTFNRNKYKKIEQVSSQVYVIWHSHGGDSSSYERSRKELKSFTFLKKWST